jgi:NAD(P)-dependent dehydrogenase (short-subunit alcohol dehydrogenase family)
MIVAGESSDLLEVTRTLAANGVLLAVVAPDRTLVAGAVALAEAAEGVVFGITTDPSARQSWSRIAPHIEQRLGPIDVVVSIATPVTREVIAAALLPDMAARRRGVLIEAGVGVESRPTPAGVRHRAVTRGNFTAADLAASVLLCASDTLSMTHLVVSSGQPPA